MVVVVLFRPFRSRYLQQMRIFEKRQQKEKTSGQVEPSCKMPDCVRRMSCALHWAHVLVVTTALVRS